MRAPAIDFSQWPAAACEAQLRLLSAESLLLVRDLKHVSSFEATARRQRDTRMASFYGMRCRDIFDRLQSVLARVQELESIRRSGGTF